MIDNTVMNICSRTPPVETYMSEEDIHRSVRYRMGFMIDLEWFI